MITKLSNGVEYNNPFFKESFAEYLLQNKWRITVNRSEISFFKHNKQIRIKNEVLDFFCFNASEEIQKWEFKGALTGLSLILDSNMFVILLHSMQIQDLRDYEENAATINDQHKVEARQFLNSLFMILKNKSTHA